MNYLSRFMKVLFLILVLSGCMKSNVEAMPYYDIRFEEVSSEIIKGDYENLNGSINLDEDTTIPMSITKSYKPTVNKYIHKDEVDAIAQVLGINWDEFVVINKQENIEIKKDEDIYIQVRPLYKEIKGNIIQEYPSWEKKKEITILMPIDVEYALNTKH